MKLSLGERVERFIYSEEIEIIPEENLIECKNCEGTGLKNYTISDDGTIIWRAWDGGEFCDECEGYGKFDWVSYIMIQKGS